MSQTFDHPSRLICAGVFDRPGCYSTAHISVDSALEVYGFKRLQNSVAKFQNLSATPLTARHIRDGSVPYEPKGFRTTDLLY